MFFKEGVICGKSGETKAWIDFHTYLVQKVVEMVSIGENKVWDEFHYIWQQNFYNYQ